MKAGPRPSPALATGLKGGCPLAVVGVGGSLDQYRADGDVYSLG